MTAIFATVLLSGSTSVTSLGQAQTLDLHLGRIVAAVLVCALLALAAALLMRRYGVPKPSSLFKPQVRAIRVLESQALSTQANVCRVTYDGREYVIVVGQAGATLLASRDVDAAAP